MEKLIVIDSYSLIYKAYYAIKEMRTSTQIPTNAIYGFVNMLLKIIKEQNPTYLYAAFDPKTPTFRHEASETYKATRQKMPDELREQIEYIIEIINYLGIQSAICDGFEADDLLGSYAKLAKETGVECVLITGDKDSFQLAQEGVAIFYAKRGISDIIEVNEDYIQGKYKMNPRQLIDLKALMGDKSDNISGITGIGEKTAQKLIIEYHDLDGVYENIESIQGKLKEKLLSGKEDAYHSRFLAEISDSAPIEKKLVRYEGVAQEEELADLLVRLEMKSILSRLDIKRKEPSLAVASEEKYCYTMIDEKNIHDSIKKIDNAEKIFIYYETICNKLSVLAVKAKETIFIIDDCTQEICKTLMQTLEKNTTKSVLHDFKTFILSAIENIYMKQIAFDIYLAAYVINPSDNSYSMNALLKKYLHMDVDSHKENTQLTFLSDSKRSHDELCMYVHSIEKLYHLFTGQIKDIEAEKLYYDIEMPLARVLASIEYEGVHIDVDELRDIGKTLDEQIMHLEDEIRELGGKDKSFNINSPKQLGTLLFEELGIPVRKKTKTGYSTDIEVLESLKNVHPIINKIIQIRKASKLNSTYVKGLLSLVDINTCKIHTTFNQTITTTGRISSSEPNLQNIPIKTPEGKLLRKVFTAQDKNHILVDADYSQIELRVLADMSGDDNLIRSFLNNEDIHRRTAAEVFNVPLEMVTNSMRSRAKAVNFGIIYGISDFGLAKNLMISRKEAKRYIEIYLQRYTDVQNYMDNMILFARKHGYVETKFKRRRYIPKINDRNYNERSFAERTALNTPIQGTAADIIKIAMNSVYEELIKQKLKSKLILQVHDELIIHAPIEEADTVSQILKEKMQSAAELKVPLKVDICAGLSWYDCK
jgi:DNA polymerase-1